MEFFSKDTAKFIFNTMKDIRGSYKSKEPGKSNEEWLVDELVKRVPETKDVVKQYGKEIMSGVNGFNRRMMSIDAAIEAGQTKEEWLRQQMKEQSKIEDMDDVGNRCAAFSESCKKSNVAYMEAEQNGEEYTIDVDAEVVYDQEEYNKFKLNKAAADLEKQVDFSSNVSLMSGSDMSCPEGYTEDDVKNNQDIGDISDEPIGSEKDNLIKVAASAALKVAANMNKVPFLSKKTPIGTICNLACWGVECAKTMKRLHDGKLNVRQAVERVGMTSCAVAAECVTKGLVTAGLSLVAGPAVAFVAAPVACNMTTDSVNKVMVQGFNKVKEYVVPLAETAYETTKPLVELAKNAFNVVKNLV